jgi:serine/threonine protein kinase
LHWQDESRALSWETRARLAHDVAMGVGYLHRRHLIHRDLNSHNCLLREVPPTFFLFPFPLYR